MIEVNLLPGATKRSRRAGAGRARRSGGAPSVDRWVLGIVGAWVLAVATVVWLFFGASGRRQELEIAIERAVQDSVRYAAIIAKQDELRARRDTIAEKLVMIQEIDAGRYIWAHLLDEISSALPEYTWLTRLATTDDDGEGYVEFQITGRTGNTFALTRFLKDLEDSPFIRGVQLTKTESVRDQSERTVHEFVVTARYEEPPLELLTTVPLPMGDN